MTLNQAIAILNRHYHRGSSDWQPSFGGAGVRIEPHQWLYEREAIAVAAMYEPARKPLPPEMTMDEAAATLNAYRYNDHDDWISVLKASGEIALSWRSAETWTAHLPRFEALAVAEKLERDAERTASHKIPLVTGL